MSTDFWASISLKEFNDRTAYAYPPTTPLNVALEWWADHQGNLLGVVVFDRFDRDYGYVVLVRDGRNRFHAIDVVCSHPTIEKVRGALYASMQEVSESGATMFPQDLVPTRP
jgi:hypothetical protein